MGRGGPEDAYERYLVLWRWLRSLGGRLGGRWAPQVRLDRWSFWRAVQNLERAEQEAAKPLVRRRGWSKRLQEARDLLLLDFEPHYYEPVEEPPGGLA